MSLTPGFAPDAFTQFQALDLHNQEIALDEIDRLALNPPAADDYVATNVRDEQGIRHYVFVRVLIDRVRNRLTVVGVGQVARPVEP
jgi:hypothetical protein